MNRREFMNWMGVGFIASSLPVAIAACSQSETPSTSSSNSTSPNSTPSNSAEFQEVGTVTALKAEGYLLNEKSPVGSIAIVEDTTTPGTFLAVNPTCTHKQCTVAWNKDQSKYICPCHDAQFSPKGEVLKEPATTHLPVYEVKVEGDKILAKAV